MADPVSATQLGIRPGLIALVAEYGGTCIYCGVRLTFDEGQPTSATREHVHPASLGGTRENGNMVPACAWCNNHKGDNSIAEWYAETVLRGWCWPPEPFYGCEVGKAGVPGSRKRLKAYRNGRQEWRREQRRRILDGIPTMP